MPQIIVRQLGRILIEGVYRFSTMTQEFPEGALKVGDEAVLFLRALEDDSRFVFTDGPYGVFRINAGQVLPLTQEVAHQRGDQPVEVVAFLSDLVRRTARLPY